MKPIKFRFWNIDYIEPIMEYGTTDDLKFVERSIGKDKMMCIGEFLGKEFYVKDICKIHNTNPTESAYQYYGVICEGAFGYLYKIINRQNMYDAIHNMNVNDEIIGNLYQQPEKYKEMYG